MYIVYMMTGSVLRHSSSVTRLEEIVPHMGYTLLLT